MKETFDYIVIGSGFLGFQKLNFFKHALVLSGTGVSGGSLVYGNTLMVPPAEFFRNKQWSSFNESPSAGKAKPVTFVCKVLS